MKGLTIKKQMLLQKQVSELLKRCEHSTLQKLIQIRAHLTTAENRSSAIWELIAIDAFSKIGKVEYEPGDVGRPDIRLSMPEQEPVWIELAFLMPRFWKEKQQSKVVLDWIFSEGKKLGIPNGKLYPKFYGINTKGQGPVRRLPFTHEKKKFLNQIVLKEFFKQILEEPTLFHEVKLKDYTIEIIFNPNSKENLRISSGLVQEAPFLVKEHALYRVLKSKAKQHKVEEPYIICVGSDQSPALVNMYGPNEIRQTDAINSCFKSHSSVSAIITISIESHIVCFQRIQRKANRKLYINLHSRRPLTKEAREILRRVDFNRWKYTSSLVNCNSRDKNNFPKMSGMLNWRSSSTMEIEIEIPGNVLVDILAGKTTLEQEYSSCNPGSQVYQAIDKGWGVEGCTFKKGNIEEAEPPKVVLKLSPWAKVFEQKNLK